MDVQDKVYQISAKQVGFAIVVLVTVFGSGPVANYVSPDVRSKAFTSDDGERQQQQIDQLQHDVEVLTATVMDWQKVCEGRYDKVAVLLENHSVNIANHEVALRECIRRTQ